MKIIECYEVQSWDGGERHNHAFYVATKEEAQEHVAKNKYDMFTSKILVVYDSLQEKEENSRKELKRKALEKLTPLERQALGFSSDLGEL